MKVIKTLSKSIREYKKQSIITPILMVFEVFFECILPLITASLINTLQSYTTDTAVQSEGFVAMINNAFLNLANGDVLNSIIFHGFLLIFLAILSFTCGALAGREVSIASAGFGKNLRKDMFYNIQKFSFNNIDNFSESSLVTRLTTDVTNVQTAYMMIIRLGVRAPLMFLVSICLSFTVSTTLSLICLGLVLCVIVLALLIFRRVFPIFSRAFKKYDKLNESVQENIQGIRVVKTFVREEHEKQKFKVASDDIKKELTTAEKIIALVNPLMSTTMYIFMLTIVFVGALIVMGTIHPLGDNMGLGEITSIINYSMQSLMSLLGLGMIFGMCMMSVESSKRIVQVINQESDLVNGNNPIEKIEDGSIDFENVSFKYSENAPRFALENVNLHIDSGETVGILGGTGSSKTTLVQLIPRIYDTTQGVVKVAGIDVRKYDLVKLRDNVSMVLQKNVLFEGTISENLRWGNKEATQEQIEKVCKIACADSFIDQFPDKYEYKIAQGGTNVSGGQKQRLCIARALLKDPKILILDDSTSAVDMRTDAKIRQAFKEQLQGITKIIIAQRVASVMDADKIVVLDNGKIVDVGKHEDLLNRCDIYKEVYESQTKKEDN